MTTWHTTCPAALVELHEPAGPRPVPMPRSLRPAIRAVPNPACHIRVTGTLLADAEWRVVPQGRDHVAGVVHVLIDQPGAVVIRATKAWGSQPCDLIAGSACAARLRRGTRITVEGTHLVPHPSGHTLELFGVSYLAEPHPRPSAVSLGAPAELDDEVEVSAP